MKTLNCYLFNIPLLTLTLNCGSIWRWYYFSEFTLNRRYLLCLILFWLLRGRDFAMRNAHSACCLLRQVKDARETKEGREEASPNSVGLVFSLALCVARAIQGYHPQPRKNLDRNFCENCPQPANNIFVRSFAGSDKQLGSFLSCLTPYEVLFIKFLQTNSSPSVLSQDSF